MVKNEYLIDARKVYHATMHYQEEDFCHLALMVQLDETSEPNKLCFHDTERGRTSRGEMLEFTPEKFVWQTLIRDDTTGEFEKGVKATFELMTLEEFEKTWRTKVTGDLPQFNSALELYEWYRRFGPAANFI